MTPIYFDTNALIELVEGEGLLLGPFALRSNAEGRRLVTSEISLAELLVKPLRDGETDLATLYEHMLSQDGIVEAHPADRSTLRLSAEIRAVHGGGFADSIHAATATQLGCRMVVSSDRRLRLPPELIRVPAAKLLDWRPDDP